jgi:Ser/Thr protein kinase RdoA (MazF antagonist)
VTAPKSDELLAALRDAGVPAVDLTRRPYRYATSAPLEELRVRTDDGDELPLIFKDLSRERLIGQALHSKPPFLWEPRRELECYRRILTPAGLGPRCFAVVADQGIPRHWLFIERVRGVELWQIGEFPVWEEVGRWLGRLHASFAARVNELRDSNPYLVEHSDSWFRGWHERALSALSRSEDERAGALRRALGTYDEVIETLTDLPRTFLHGEFYPSNVLVVAESPPVQVYPVDWEMAAVGPGIIDLAALVGGWEQDERRRLVAAYEEAYAAGGEGGITSGEPAVDLSRCRLHLALQWLGWSPEWRPPPEHAHDWVGEALALTEELGLR